MIISSELSVILKDDIYIHTANIRKKIGKMCKRLFLVFIFCSLQSLIQSFLSHKTFYMPHSALLFVTFQFHFLNTFLLYVIGTFMMPPSFATNHSVRLYPGNCFMCVRHPSFCTIWDSGARILSFEHVCGYDCLLGAWAVDPQLFTNFNLHATIAALSRSFCPHVHAKLISVHCCLFGNSATEEQVDFDSVFYKRTLFNLCTSAAAANITSCNVCIQTL